MGGVGGVGGVCGRGDIDGVSESGVGMGGSVNRERFYGGGLMELEQQCSQTDYTCITKNTFCNGNLIRPCAEGTICKTCDSPPCTTNPCVYPHHIGDFALLHQPEVLTPAPQPS